MTDDEQLRQLLQAADAVPAPQSASPGHLAGRVRSRARRRRAARSAAIAACVLAAVAGAALRLARLPADRQRLAEHDRIARHDQPQPPAPIPAPAPPRPVAVVDAAELQRENAQLEAEARLHLLTAEAMLRREASAARAASATRAAVVLARPDPIDEIAAGRARAARTMLHYGDRLLREPDPGAAAVAYQRVLELFPASPEAESARRRLAQIKT